MKIIHLSVCILPTPEIPTTFQSSLKVANSGGTVSTTTCLFAYWTFLVETLDTHNDVNYQQYRKLPDKVPFYYLPLLLACFLSN